MAWVPELRARCSVSLQSALCSRYYMRLVSLLPFLHSILHTAGVSLLSDGPQYVSVVGLAGMIICFTTACISCAAGCG